MTHPIPKGTVIIELAGFIMLTRHTVPRSRWGAIAVLYLCAVCWSGMHVGILFTMGIRYQPQMLTYWTLLVPWTAPTLPTTTRTSTTEEDDEEDDEEGRATSSGPEGSGAAERPRTSITKKAKKAAPVVPMLAWWDDQTRRASKVSRIVLSYTLMVGFLWVVIWHRDDFWPLTPVMMFSHKRTAQWHGECLRSDLLHQFASEDICVTSAPKLYADVHFVYAAIPGEDGPPGKVLTRAGYIESQLDAFSIDPAGMQTKIVDPFHISSPNRLRARALRLTLRHLFFNKDKEKRHGKVAWDRYISDDGEPDLDGDGDGEPTPAQAYLAKVLSVSAGRRHYFEEANKLVPNLIDIHHNYSYTEPSTAVGKLLGVEFILNRCAREAAKVGSSERTLLAALRVDGADGQMLKRECEEARKAPPPVGKPVMALAAPLANYLGGQFSGAKLMKTWCEELEEPAGAMLSFAMNPTMNRYCGNNLDLIETGGSCNEYCDELGRTAVPSREYQCTGACRVEKETTCACKEGLSLRAKDCKKHTGGTKISLLCQCE